MDEDGERKAHKSRVAENKKKLFGRKKHDERPEES
jgi:hypothetical protein